MKWVAVGLLALLAPPLTGTNAATPEDSRPYISLSADALTSFAGYYRAGKTAYLKVWVKDDHLVAEMRGRGGAVPIEVFAETDRLFFRKLSKQKVRFSGPSGSAATAAIFENDGLSEEFTRINEQEAVELEKAINVALSARLAANTPLPGSETLLRRHVEALLTGTPLYQEMAAPLAKGIMGGMPQLLPMLNKLGPIQAITFRSVAKDGWDIYDIAFQGGTTEWRIGPLDDSGRLSSFAMNLAVKPN
jgi:hypothetical protein